MPAIIPIIINAIVTAVVVAVVDVVVDVVVEAIFGSDEIETRDEMQQQSETAARARALLVNKNSNNSGIPLVYGKYRMGGVRVYLETSNGSGSIANNDAGNEYFNMVMTMCEGEMGVPKDIYFGDIIIWTNTGSNYSVSNGAYTLNSFVAGTEYSGANISIVYHDGRADQTVDTMIQNSVGNGVWTNNHRLRGIAYLAIKIQANAEIFAGGVPVVTATLDGKDIPDVQFISEGQTSTPAVEEGENSNPANVIYDYLTNTIYGKGLDHTTTGSYQAGLDIDIASFKQARLDLIAAYSGGTGSNMFNGTLSTGQKLYENLQRLARSCNGMLTFSGGKYRLIIQKKGETVPQTAGTDNASHLFSEDNILGQVTVNRGKKSTKINKVTAGFTDQATNYIDNIIVTNDAGALAEDNGTVLEASLDHQLTTNSAFVTRMNEYRIDKTRNQTAIVFTASHKALAVECGDIIKVTQVALGWDNKLFRAVTITLNSDNEVAISAIEYISSIQI